MSMSIKKLFLLFTLIFFTSNFVISETDSFEDDEESENYGIVIGIDLGTTYSSVGVYKNNKVEIIQNDLGNRITPSYVAYSANERLVGESAKNQFSKNPKNTIYSSKRLIGRRFSERSVQKDIKDYTYTVKEKKGMPIIKVKYKNKKIELKPEEVSAAILGKMKKIAENYLGEKVSHAVVTVPAYFNDAQRQATKKAGVIADLNIIRIINEPTAAALAYGIGKNQTKELNVLVYDLGGGTFDVSLLSVEDGVFEVKATNGDTHLGGEDFDTNLAKYLAKQFKEKEGVDLMKNVDAFAKLKRESEKAKRALSSSVSTKIEIDNIVSGKSLSMTINRATFEKVNMHLFRKTLKPVKTVLTDSKLKKSQIDEVVLVGGSTRIPKIQSLLKDFFDGKKLNKEIHPDEAVAYGAAVQGAILGGEGGEDTKDMLLLDVTPLSFGIETVGGVHSKVIMKNTPIPTSKSQTFTTNENDQTTVTISVFEGEAKMTKYNHLLGRFDLTGIDKAPRGVPQIEVKFDIDANGILIVSAKDKSSGKNNNLEINEAMSSESSEDINKMKENYEKFQEEDERIYNQTMAKNKLSSAIHSAEDLKKKESTDKEDAEDLERLIDEMKQWNQSNEVEKTKVEKYEEKIKEIEEVINEIKNEEEGKGEDGEEDGEEDEEDEEGEESSGKKKKVPTATLR